MIRPGDIPDRLAALRRALGGRAAGAWRVEADRLALVAFDPAPDLPADVALGFEVATRSVSRSLVALGIARAAASGEPAVSLAATLPSDAGSGYWLRAFGASRSVAVPIPGEAGRAGWIVSVALGPEPGDDAVIATIRRFSGEAGGTGLDGPGPRLDNSDG